MKQSVIGAGCDGELEPHEVETRLNASADAGALLSTARISPEVADELEAAARAIKDGANLAGYFVWSLLDNFEWGWGYQKRFGIVFVDFGTQRRIPKASAAFFADVVKANAIPLLPAAWPH